MVVRLCNCEAYEDYCTKTSKNHNAPFLLDTTKHLLTTAKFLKNTGAFTMMELPYEPPSTLVILGLHLPILDDLP